MEQLAASVMFVDQLIFAALEFSEIPKQNRYMSTEHTIYDANNRKNQSTIVDVSDFD